MSYMKISVNDYFTEYFHEKIKKLTPRAAHALAVVISSDTEPFVPALNLDLYKRTRVVENKIIYPGPYARYLYYGKVMVDRETGRGPFRINDKGTIIYRFRKGAKLKPTDKPLKIQQSVHAQAQDHWFEGSKAQNMDKWVEAAERLIEREFGK